MTDFFDILGPVEEWNKKFRVHHMAYQIRWNDMQQSPDLEETILTALQTILDQVQVRHKEMHYLFDAFADMLVTILGPQALSRI